MNTINQYWKNRKKKIFSWLVVHVVQKILRVILITCKIKVSGNEIFLQRKNHKTILMLWHNRLTIAPYILNNFTKDIIFSAVVSNSRDGELLDAVVKSYKRGRTIRVPYQQRHKALHEVIKTLMNKEDVVIITPDGPRGPIYKVKPGIVFAARETKAAIIPLTWNSDQYWEMNTWDRLRIPKPFAKICVSFGSPIFVKESEDFHEETRRLENVLHKLSEQVS